MRNIQIQFWFLFSMFLSTNLWPQEYLVKVTNQKSAQKTLAKYGPFRSLTLSFGNYLVFQSNTPLAQLKAGLANAPDIIYLQPVITYRALPMQTAEEVLEQEEEWIDWNTFSTNSDHGTQDPLFPRQWGMQNTGDNSRYNLFFSGKEGEDLQIVPVWEHKILGDRRIKVAVIDTGIDDQHPDLRDNLWINHAELDGIPDYDDDGNGYKDDVYGYNFYDNNGNTMDKIGHGTHCAGVIGAIHNNGIGVAGVMGEVQLVAVKFLGGFLGTGTTLGAIAAIDYAMKIGVDVMSNSWGGGE